MHAPMNSRDSVGRKVDFSVLMLTPRRRGIEEAGMPILELLLWTVSPAVNHLDKGREGLLVVRGVSLQQRKLL